MKRRYARSRALTWRMLLAVGFLMGEFAALGYVLYRWAPGFWLWIPLFLGYWAIAGEALLKWARTRRDRNPPPEIVEMVERLAGMANVRPPEVWFVTDNAPNAFVIPRFHGGSTMVVTTGLVERLEIPELEAVVAHELSHVANLDAYVLTLATLPAMAFEFFAFWFGLGAGTYLEESATGLLRVVRRVYRAVHDLLMLVTRMVSRVREFAADRGSALLTGRPEELMSALQKISDGVAQIPREDLRQPESLQAFLIIPVRARQRVSALLADHPPLERRLAALEEMAREFGKRA